MTTPNSPGQHSKDPAPPLPGPGVKKTNAEELDRELDVAIEQTMDASDPPAVTLPEVKIRKGRDKDKGKAKGADGPP